MDENNLVLSIDTEETTTMIDEDKDADVCSFRNPLPLLQKYWSESAIVTDFYSPRVSRIEKLKALGFVSTLYNRDIIKYGEEIPVENLLPGEIISSKYKIGCYVIRHSIYAYQDRYKNIPISAKKAAEIRISLEKPRIHPCFYDPSLYTVIGAKHIDDSSDSYKIICRFNEHAMQPMVLDYICTAKENKYTLDSYASLFIKTTFGGSSMTVYHCHLLSPTGRIKQLTLHNWYQENWDTAKFEDYNFIDH